MSYTERSLTADFSKHLRSHPFPFRKSAAIEFKVIKGNTLNLKNHLRPHQIPCLIKAQHQFIYHKLSDLSASLLPFDSFCLKDALSYLAVLFYKKRNQKILYFINIDTVLSFKLIKDKITKQDCENYAELKINL